MNRIASSEGSRRRFVRMKRLISSVMLVSLLAVGTVVAAPQSAHATSAQDFKPGNIISDAAFYDGKAMTAAQVQAFTEQRVPRCTIGDAGRAAGSLYGSQRVATKCLRNFTMNTSSKATNAYCGAYSGRAGESAAQIITRVGQVCGISQKVLLVMLEKEQSLLSDSWPLVRQFDVAMGYGCPDTGPNYGANCDPTQLGFFNQVYRAAWQLKVYLANPTSFNYRPSQTNTLQWHPSPGCGTSKVYIENRATAALYIYTPYRPNQTALNAGWGTGDGCSSYGNRNFFLFYKSWFGSTQSFEVDTKLTTEYSHLGGSSGFLGSPKSAAVLYADGGIGQGFASGSMYWSPRTVASAVRGQIRTFFWDNGSAAGWLGYPNGRMATYSDGGQGQAFLNASVYWSQSSGAHAINGQIRSAYWDSGSTGGLLGYPAGSETTYSDGGKGQGFQYGSIYWSADRKGWPVPAGLRKYYWDNGSAQGRLGYPEAEPIEVGGGQSQRFAGGTVLISPSFKGATLSGGVLTRFEETGGVNTLGFPTGEVATYANGSVGQGFQRGSIYGFSRDAVFTVDGAIRDYYWDNKSISGPLGYPVEEKFENSIGDTQQKFQGGYVVATESRALSVRNAFALRYSEVGGLASPLGAPTAEAISYGPLGFGQGFAGGSMYQRGSRSAFEVTGDIRAAFWNSGSIYGDFGFPVSTVECVDTMCVQEFEGGPISVPWQK